jgi:hypothetical protein
VPLHIIDSQVAPVKTIAVVVATALLAPTHRAKRQDALERGRAESPSLSPNPHAVALSDSRWEIDRSQVETALAELLGQRPATLGAELAPLPLWRTRALEREMFVRMAELGERLHVAILSRVDQVSIAFPDANHTSRWIDEWITARWGAPAHIDRCSRWIDPVRQYQVSRCRSPIYADRDQGGYVVLSWTRYLTPRQWVGARGERFGMEPFALIGASGERMKQLMAEEGRDRNFARWSWHAPPIGPPVWSEPTIEADGFDHVERWFTGVATDPALFGELLRAKYGRPAYDDGACQNGRIGRLRWEVDGHNIEAHCFREGVSLFVYPLER